jgi:quinol monooxygenase YgiN
LVDKAFLKHYNIECLVLKIVQIQYERHSMYIKVISRRVFRTPQRDELIPLLRELREKAEAAEGFVSRITYSKLNDPGEFIVISEWQNADFWAEWMNRMDVREIQWKIDSLIGEKTFFDIYKPEEF